MTGPGKYDALCTAAREGAEAQGCILIVFGGKEGPGFSAQVPDHVARHVPQLLRSLADSIERDVKGMKEPNG